MILNGAHHSTGPAMVASPCDGEVDTTELAHADSTVWEPGRGQLAQGNGVTLFTAYILYKEIHNNRHTMGVYSN